MIAMKNRKTRVGVKSISCMRVVLCLLSVILSGDDSMAAKEVRKAAI